MAKKNSTSPRAKDPSVEPAPAAAPKRRAAVKRTSEPVATPSIADDRDATMPEPAGQRVTPADTSASDSITFVATTAAPTYDEIAEAAYHRYLNRGGRDGQDFEDWIEAERSLREK